MKVGETPGNGEESPTFREEPKLELVMNIMKREQSIDILRGVAMCIVVFGHAIQTTYINADNMLLYRIITSIQMPLFMFISGYVTYNPERELNICWLSRRCKSLLVPFCIWIILPFILKGNWEYSEWGG